MSAALVNVSGESKIVCTNRHEPRFRRLYLISDPAVSIGLEQSSRPIITYDSAAQNLKAEEKRVTCIAHDADIATDRRNPIID